MRGNPQAVSLRLRAAPTRRCPVWLERAQENRRRAQLEHAEVIVRLQADERQARRSGEHRDRRRAGKRTRRGRDRAGNPDLIRTAPGR